MFRKTLHDCALIEPSKRVQAASWRPRHHEDRAKAQQSHFYFQFAFQSQSAEDHEFSAGCTSSAAPGRSRWKSAKGSLLSSSAPDSTEAAVGLVFHSSPDRPAFQDSPSLQSSPASVALGAALL